MKLLTTNRKLYLIGGTYFLTLPTGIIGKEWFKHLNYDDDSLFVKCENNNITISRTGGEGFVKGYVHSNGLLALPLNRYILPLELYNYIKNHKEPMVTVKSRIPNEKVVFTILWT